MPPSGIAAGLGVTRPRTSVRPNGTDVKAGPPAPGEELATWLSRRRGHGPNRWQSFAAPRVSGFAPSLVVARLIATAWTRIVVASPSCSRSFVLSRPGCGPNRSQLDDAWGGDSPDTSLWTLAGFTALIAALPLVVIGPVSGAP